MQDQGRLWYNLELRIREEAFSTFTVKALKRAAAAYKVITRAGVDGIRSMVPLDLSDECGERILKLLHKVEMAGRWPTSASAALFCLISKITTSEQSWIDLCRRALQKE